MRHDKLTVSKRFGEILDAADSAMIDEECDEVPEFGVTKVGVALLKLGGLVEVLDGALPFSVKGCNNELCSLELQVLHVLVMTVFTSISTKQEKQMDV